MNLEILTALAVYEEADIHEDWHYGAMIVMAAVMALLVCTFVVCYKRINHNKSHFDISMSKLGKTVAMYDIHKGILHIPEPYAGENNLPSKVENMPEGILEIMKLRTGKEGIERLKDFLNDIAAGRDSESLKIKVIGSVDRKEKWLELDYYTFTKKGKPVQAYISFSDMTTEHSHMLAFERFKLITNSTSATSLDYSLLDVTDDCIDIACGRLMPEKRGIQGMSIRDYHEELKGMRLYNASGDNVLEYFSKEKLEKYYKEGRYTIEDVWTGTSIINSQIWIILTARIIKDTFDGHIRCYLEYKDITDRKLEELRLKEMSVRDGMTGLYNQSGTHDIIRNRMNSRKGVHIMALFDLDGLKKINDTFGHPEGDRIIRAFSNKLKLSFGGDFIAGRLGGDEFAVYINAPEDWEKEKAMLEGFIPSMSLNIKGDSEDVKVTCSGGAACCEGDDCTYNQLYKKADTALYHAKKHGRNSLVFYNDSMEITDHIRIVDTDKTDLKMAGEAFSYLFKNHMFNAVEDIFIRSEKDALILVDAADYHVDYINMKNREDIEKLFPDWENRPCYELICEKKEPCTDCRRNNMDKHMLMPRKFQCSRFPETDYILLDRVNVREHRDVHLHFLKNTSDPDYISDMEKRSNKALNVLRYCVDVDMKNLLPEDTFREIIKALCEHFNAQSGYITSFNRNIGTVFYEKSRITQKPVPDAVIESLYSHSSKRSLVYIDEMDKIKEENMQAYSFFKDRGTESVAIFPVTEDNRIYGYLYMENFNVNRASFTMLYEISGILANCIIRHLIRLNSANRKYMDPITGVLNYEGFIKRASETFDKPDNRTYAFWTIGIKDYKEIIKTYGEGMANQMIQHCAQLIERKSPVTELFCRDYNGRFSGMRIHGGYDIMSDVNREFQKEIETYLKKVHGIDKNVDISCGVCTAVNDGTRDVEGIIVASLAMEKKAEAMEGSQLLYTDSITEDKTMEDSLLENSTYNAMLHDEFEIYFQPKLKLETRKKEYTIYAEVLARWMRDGKVFSMPSEFIPILKNSGKITEFDLYIFEKACRTLSEYMIKGMTDIVLAVNITEETALMEDVVSKYEEIRNRYHVPAGFIELEISENVLYSNVNAISNVIELFNKKGYLCTLDDFGVEKSTLYMLPQLMVDAIKLDRNFFRSDVNRARQNIVVKNLINMADELDMVIICEGVERQEEIDFLVKSGCEYVQGYYHEKPMNHEAFTAYIRKERV